MLDGEPSFEILASGDVVGQIMSGGSSERLVRGGVRARPHTRSTLTKYITVLLATILGSAASALLFLVPLYADPALSSLAADFSPSPAQCITERHDERLGLDNCTWASCREGCTSDVYRCTQIHVKYRPRGDNWHEAILFVNIKGCGYPPMVDCYNFTSAYGTLGAQFTCYWSRADPSVVVPYWSRSEQMAVVTRTLLLPLFLTVCSGIGLCALHCDCRARRRRPPRRPPRGKNNATGTAEETTIYRLA